MLLDIIGLTTSICSSKCIVKIKIRVLKYKLIYAWYMLLIC
jgi:hypothetical protein